jgi:metallo-beta-lactamase family protein
MVSIHFLGANREVTGSCYVIDYQGFKVMVDCGMYQGDEELEKRNAANFLFDPKEIDVLLLTHAHLDHCGLIPKLVKHGFNGKIYLTAPTRDIFEITAYDTAKIQKEDALREPGSPIIYNAGDVVNSIAKCQVVNYNDRLQLTNDFYVTFKQAGHILGSAFLYMEVDGKKIVFSGDVGHKGQSIIKPLEYVDDVDYLIVESTYGDRLHKPRVESEEELIATINKSIENHGNIIIPCFAIERTQELIYDLKSYIAQNRLATIPATYVDSPMAGKVTSVFSKYFGEYNTEAKDIVLKGDNPFYFENLKFIQDIKKSRRVSIRNIGKNKKGDSIMVLAGSGMCTGGRVLSYLMKNLPLSRSTVIFPGFQAEGTLGREIVDGEKEVYIYDKKVHVRANIVTLGGFSAHGDKADLLDWISPMKHKLKKVFIAHGDEAVSLRFADILNQELGLTAMVPYYDTVENVE